MTKNNEQIIIDGVDVSGCIVFNNKWGTPLCNHLDDIRTAIHCSDSPNCLYKKYKRKEQENKDLKEDIKDIANLLDLDTGEEYNFGNIELEIKHLKAKEQECEELKAKFELFKTSNQTTIDQLKAENEDLKKSVLQECPNCGEEYLNYKGAALYFENSDLKQALAEIKEFCIDHTQLIHDAYPYLNIILDKINEVEDE